MAGRIVDRYETPFGIRTIAVRQAKGFLLNGRRVKLQGVCLHHDLGALGAAVNRRATERQLRDPEGHGRQRHPHQPQSARRRNCSTSATAWASWSWTRPSTCGGSPRSRTATRKYFDEWSERDLRDMIRRDRNHPSVIMWSIGNEIPEQSSADGWEMAKRLTAICHEEDPTRPTTSAFDQWPAAIKNGWPTQVDIPGFNYKPTPLRRDPAGSSRTG